MLLIGLYVYDQVEVLDVAGPFEVLNTALRFCETPPWRVQLIAERMAPVRARGGLVIEPHGDLTQARLPDVLLVPGGVHEAQLAKPAVIDWLARAGQQAQWVVSVCTGAFLLAEAGLLDGRRVTTHWEDIAALRRDYPLLQVEGQGRWVEDGNRLTSAGISAGIDMSLHLVARLHSRELAERTARQMDYRWQR